MNPTQIADAAAKLEGKTPLEILKWAADTYQDKLAIGTSLGAEAIVIMDMAVQVAPRVPFIFLDTGFHFGDTLALLDTLKKRYNLNLITAKTDMSVEAQAAEHGDQLYFREPSKCCDIRKVEPMRKALKPYEAWVTGMRRDQTAMRAGLQHAEWDGKFGLLKISPILNWTHDQVWEYIRSKGLPYNRLHDMGYPSIGCAPCTKPVKPGEDPRAGRWAGFDKSECGLHTR